MIARRALLLLLLLPALGWLACDGDSDPSPEQNNEQNNGTNNGANNGDNNQPGATRLDFEEIALPGDPREVTEFKFDPSGDGTFWVFEKSGQISHLRLEGDAVTELGSFRVEMLNADLDCGLLSLTFAPDYAQSRHAYVGLCTSVTESAIIRLTLDTQDYGGIPASRTTLLTVGDSRAQRPWHNIGSMGFDSSGALWALFGEKTQRDNAQNLENELGGMIRLIPGEDGESYLPAPGNPFAESEDGRSPLLYAWGLRSPWKGVLDSQGRWWIGDVGDNYAEEINRLTEPGTNFGWPLSEGPCQEGCDGLTDPVAWWDRSDAHPYVLDDEDVEPAVARTSWVGLMVEPRDNDPYQGRLDNTLLYGDLCLGYVRGLVVDAQGQVQDDVHLGHKPNLSGWDVGPDGYLYAASFGACESKFGPQPSSLYRVKLR